MSNSIFYYTSNLVLKEWFKNEKIWATRSVTSNDGTDTLYMIEHFNEAKEYLVSNTNFDEKEIEKILDNTRKLLYVTKNVSLRVLKDCMYYSLEKDYKNLNSALTEAIKLSEKVQSYKKDKNEVGKFLGENVTENFYINLIHSMKLDDLSELLKIDCEKIEKSLILNSIRTEYPYVICFSQQCDNRFFWDSYTNNKGVCLEFFKEELITYFREEYRAICGEVAYDKQGCLKNMKMALDVIEQVEKQNEGNFFNKYEAFSSVGTMIKNPYWKVEKEIRAVFLSKYFNDDQFQVKENYNLKYKGEYETQDYIEVKIPRYFVKRIILGPLNSKKDIDLDILDFFDNRVMESKGTGVIKPI